MTYYEARCKIKIKSSGITKCGTDVLAPYVIEVTQRDLLLLAPDPDATQEDSLRFRFRGSTRWSDERSCAEPIISTLLKRFRNMANKKRAYED